MFVATRVLLSPKVGFELQGLVFSFRSETVPLATVGPQIQSVGVSMIAKCVGPGSTGTGETGRPPRTAVMPRPLGAFLVIPKQRTLACIIGLNPSTPKHCSGFERLG